LQALKKKKQGKEKNPVTKQKKKKKKLPSYMELESTKTTRVQLKSELGNVIDFFEGQTHFFFQRLLGKGLKK